MRMKRWLILGLLVLGALALALALVLARPYVIELLKIDKCLDLGGRWNYDLGQCEYKAPDEPK